MSIGKNIYELRKKHELTQSELAQKLGVTEQSVSKWENDVCAPDVTMFPQLAKLFNISIDRLYGFHLDSYDKEVQKILDEAENISFDSPHMAVASYVAYYEKALKEFPNSDRIKLSLAHYYHMMFRVGDTEEEQKAAAGKAMSILHEIIGTSFDEEILDEANLRLASVYSQTGRYAKALDVLGRVSPGKYNAKMIYKTQFLTESKDYEALRRHTEKVLFECYMCMDTVTSFYYNTLHERGDFEQALQYCNLKEKLLCLFDERGETLYTANKINNAFQKAHMLRRFDRKEECYETLLYLTELAKAELKITDTAGHKISVLNGFFGTYDEIEPHMRSENVKEHTTFMLSQFKDYFAGDKRYDALLKDICG